MELKSCPLCGGKIDERGWQCNYGDRNMTLNLKCEKCGTIFKFKSNWLVDPYSEEELAMLTALRSEDEDYDIGNWC